MKQAILITAWAAVVIVGYVAVGLHLLATVEGEAAGAWFGFGWILTIPLIVLPITVYANTEGRR